MYWVIVSKSRKQRRQITGVLNADIHTSCDALFYKDTDHFNVFSLFFFKRTTVIQ